MCKQATFNEMEKCMHNFSKRSSTQSTDTLQLQVRQSLNWKCLLYLEYFSAMEISLLKFWYSWTIHLLVRNGDSAQLVPAVTFLHRILYRKKYYRKEEGLILQSYCQQNRRPEGTRHRHIGTVLGLSSRSLQELFTSMTRGLYPTD